MEKQIGDLKSNQKQLVSGANLQGNFISKQNQQNYTEEKLDDKNMLKCLENKMKEMETDFDLEDNIVIDLGSAFTKIGYSGEDLPRLIIPSIYSKLIENTNNKAEINLEKNQYLFGYDIFSEKDDHRFMYNTKYLNPGDHKDSIDSESFLDLLNECFKREGIIASDHNVIINASPIRNKDNIDKLTNLFLNDLGFKGMSIINSSSLALFATGRTSGLVIDCGEHKTMCVPIYEGFPLYHALNISQLGGRNVSQMFLEGIKSAYPEFNQDEIILIREIKEKMCNAPYLKDADEYLNKNIDILKENQKLYKMPNGEIIEIPKQNRINAGEILFKYFFN